MDVLAVARGLGQRGRGREAAVVHGHEPRVAGRRPGVDDERDVVEIDAEDVALVLRAWAGRGRDSRRPRRLPPLVPRSAVDARALVPEGARARASERRRVAPRPRRAARVAKRSPYLSANSGSVDSAPP